MTVQRRYLKWVLRQLPLFHHTFQTNYCPVETTLIPETTCVCVIHVRPKREDTEISFEGTVIKSEIEKGFSLEIPAKAFAEKTVFSLKVG